jgi:hypothetical protein
MMWFAGINYYKLAIEKDRNSIFTTIMRPCISYGNQALDAMFLYLNELHISYDYDMLSI